MMLFVILQKAVSVFFKTKKQTTAQAFERFLAVLATSVDSVFKAHPSLFVRDSNGDVFLSFDTFKCRPTHLTLETYSPVDAEYLGSLLASCTRIELTSIKMSTRAQASSKQNSLCLFSQPLSMFFNKMSQKQRCLVPKKTNPSMSFSTSSASYKKLEINPICLPLPCCNCSDQQHGVFRVASPAFWRASIGAAYCSTGNSSSSSSLSAA